MDRYWPFIGFHVICMHQASHRYIYQKVTARKRQIPEMRSYFESSGLNSATYLLRIVLFTWLFDTKKRRHLWRRRTRQGNYMLSITLEVHGKHNDRRCCRCLLRGHIDRFPVRADDDAACNVRGSYHATAEDDFTIREFWVHSLDLDG